MQNQLSQTIFGVIQDFLGLEKEEEKKPEPKGLASRPDQVNVDTAVDVSLRPKARPVDDFVVRLADTAMEESLRPRARPDIPIDPTINSQKLINKYNTSVVDFRNANKGGGSAGTRLKVNKLNDSDSALNDIISRVELISEPMLKPRARPKSIEDMDVATSAMALGVIPVKGKSYTPTIRDTQIMLDSAGYNVGKIDGIDGPLTQAAVKAFQKDAGFTGRDIDGKFGPKTLAAFIQKNPQVTKKELQPLAATPSEKTMPTTKAMMIQLPFMDKVLKNKYVDLATSTPAKLLIKNIMGLDRNMIMGNKPIPITETSFKKDELQHFRSMWNTYGEGQLTRGQQIDNAKNVMNVITGKDEAPYNLPASINAYYSVGDTYLYQDKNGDVILKDIYDYNFYTDYSAEPIINKDTGEKEYPRIPTEEFESDELGYSTTKGVKDTLQAYATGKIGFMSAAHNLGFLLGSRDYQDPDKDEGTPILVNLGNPETWDEEGVSKVSEEEGLMAKPKPRSEDLEPVEDSITLENLTISNATREKYPTGTGGLINISLDYNAAPKGKSASGVEIIIPDDASPEVVASAKAYVKRVKDFADSNGYGGYKIRKGGKFGDGIKTTSESKLGGGGGMKNTIHAEPFFNTDTKMQNIINENFSDFAKIYADVFKDLDARIVIPHTSQKTGAESELFGNEYSFGKRMIDTLMRS